MDGERQEEINGVITFPTALPIDKKASQEIFHRADAKAIIAIGQAT